MYDVAAGTHALCQLILCGELCCFSYPDWTMVNRCVVAGCSNTHKDVISLFYKKWGKNTHALHGQYCYTKVRKLC